MGRTTMAGVSIACLRALRRARNPIHGRADRDRRECDKRLPGKKPLPALFALYINVRNAQSA
jgi:hypothetical protein